MKSSTFDNITSILAEFFGTGIFVFLGCMGCTWGTDTSALKTSLSFGLAVMVVLQCFGCVSGAHINPAVTLASYIIGKTSLKMAFAYFCAQMLGSFMGYALLMSVLPKTFFTDPNGHSGFCFTRPHPDINSMQATFIEFSVTAALILFSCSIWDPRNAKKRDTIPVRFCLAIISLALTAGKFTEASMNPARSFAPALWNLDFQYQRIYWFGPLSAAIVVGNGYKYVFWRETEGKFTEASMNPARSFAPALWNLDFQYQRIYWFGPLSAAIVVGNGYKYVFWRETEVYD